MEEREDAMKESVPNIQNLDESYAESAEKLKTLMDEIEFLSNDQADTRFTAIARENQKLHLKDDSVLNVATHQNQYICQLEQEVSFLREQFGTIRNEIQEVISENEHLRDDARRSYSFLIEREAKNVNNEATDNLKFGNPHEEIFGKWQRELVRIRSLYQATSDRLQDQVDCLRSELDTKREQIEDLKSKIRSDQSDSFVDQAIKQAPNLCLNCASQQGVLFANSPSNGFSGTVKILLKDKEELSQMLAKQRIDLRDAEAREEDSLHQVKNSVLLVEQAHFEKTELEAENIHLKQNLKKEEERIKDIVTEYKDNLKRERELVTEEWSQRLTKMKEKVFKMNEEQVEMKVNLEKSNSEKESIQKALESTKDQVKSLQEKIIVVQNSTKIEISELVAERKRFVESLGQHKNEKDHLEKGHKMEIESMQTKIDAIQRNLGITEKKLLESNEQCLHLSRTITDLEKQANLAVLTKQNVERSYTDDVKTLNRESEMKIKHMMSSLETTEAEHADKLTSLDQIISSQDQIMKQLQKECSILTDKLEAVTRQAWLEKYELLEEKSNLAVSLQLAMEKLSRLEESQKDFAQAELILKQRLMDSEYIARKKSDLACELMQKDLFMNKERERLNEEVAFLHQELINLSGRREKESAC